MGKTVPIKFNDDELARLMRGYAASDDPHLGTHIKRVYFAALRPNVEVLEALRREMEALNVAVAQMRARSEKGEGQRDEALLLTMVCGIYAMLYESVSAPARILADKSIDMKQVESYLRG